MRNHKLSMSEYEYIQFLLDTIEKLTKIAKLQSDVLEQNGIEIYKSSEVKNEW